MKCWGKNDHGQIGDGTFGTDSLIPTNVSGLSSGVFAISAGAEHTCTIISTGAVKCWGLNTNGQIGDNSTGSDRFVPTEVTDLNSGAIAITTGFFHTCALLSTGAAKCWGSNNWAQIGDNTSGTDRSVPAAVSGLNSGVSSIMAAEFHTCALLSSGGVKCWGDSSMGEIGEPAVNLTPQYVVSP